jgi:hypothetical protein
MTRPVCRTCLGSAIEYDGDPCTVCEGTGEHLTDAVRRVLADRDRHLDVVYAERDRLIGLLAEAEAGTVRVPLVGETGTAA